jgi:hypothetical protein
VTRCWPLVGSLLVVARGGLSGRGRFATLWRVIDVVLVLLGYLRILGGSFLIVVWRFLPRHGRRR